MINWKFIGKVLGFILLFESLFMWLSAGVSMYYHGSDLHAILLSAGITTLAGVVCLLLSGFRRINYIIGKRESYLSVSLSWAMFALFGALPFYISREIPHFTDAFFESMSGLTTTGASILNDVEAMSKGLLFWRSLIQWLGGLGIVVFSIALLPLLGGGAAHLFDAESSKLKQEKFRPRVTQMAKRLWGMYLLFTLVLIALLWYGPMNFFDAVCHAFTTISTGGFSTNQASIRHWDSMYIETVIMVFMILGAINFPLLYFLFFKGDYKRIGKDEEFRWFLSIVLGASLVVGSGLIVYHHFAAAEAFREAFFQVVSTITTTGYSTANFSSWGSAFVVAFLFLMLVCGCAGSTSGGLKIVRTLILAKNTGFEFERMVHPRAIIPVRLNGNALSFEVVQRLLAFAFLYIFILLAGWGILTMLGLPFMESIGAATSALGNVGPGLGVYSNSYAALPSFAKWFMAFLMLVGRLELFTVLAIFTPGFWKR